MNVSITYMISTNVIMNCIKAGSVNPREVTDQMYDVNKRDTRHKVDLLDQRPHAQILEIIAKENVTVIAK